MNDARAGVPWIPAAGWLALAAGGCGTLGTVTEVGTQIAVAEGKISEEEAVSIRRTSDAVGRTFQDFTPRQEYYVGRAVAARVLAGYRPVTDNRVTTYLNRVGQALSLASDKPETFAGYHFLALNSDEINAFAAPGGFIFVSRGMLDLCESEDDLAAVLAHEIGHVVHRHGLAAIRNSRVVHALTVLAVEGARNLGSREVAELTETFEGSIDDITSTLMTRGYARELEREADAEAIAILHCVGYDPLALLGVLDRMETRLKPGGLDFARTHPPPHSRARDIRQMLLGASSRPAPATPEREARFRAAVAALP